MDKPRVYSSSDYAGMEVGDLEFYYGYEYGRDEEGEVWGFRAKNKGIAVLEYAQKYEGGEILEQLLEGIGRYLQGEVSKEKP